MAFGWSAGDILSAINFIIDAAQALDDVNGAPKEFRQASTFLRNLDKALLPLCTFTALEARPGYKANIEAEVDAIRTPIEKFMRDVDDMAKHLGGDSGSSKTSRFRWLKSISSKLEWHYFTSKKALSLQNEVEGHLRVIDTLMQRLTVDMIHKLPADIKVGMQETIDTALNTHLSLFKSSIVGDISQHDIANRSIWLQQLEELFERYLGSQRLRLTTSPAPSLPPQYTPTEQRSSDEQPGFTIYTPEMLKTNAARVEEHLIPKDPDFLPRRIDGITADVELTHRLQLWWTTPSSDLLWIQGADTNPCSNDPPLAVDISAVAREANIPVLSYTCRRLHPSTGNEIAPLDLFADLLYSLIWQCAQAISDTLNTSVDFGISRFKFEDNSPASITSALELFHDLIRAEDKFIRKIVVLNSLQLLEYSGDGFLETQFGKLIGIVLQGDTKAVGPCIKTVVLTEEQTLMLLNSVGAEKTLDASRMVGSSGFLAISELKENKP
ncbi:hypothetical protein BP6252_12488 [Coleophoma cylindrospora]|uniref:Uncharacterized protein n=1 Tax=Coleophoma cylindrospora TaxID=1849047 RepID=A0A3D8QH27_9HELO|nr:hypothetical protein BP6252_12488 [Coleophoma cylindrospora]